ncbi:putative transcriptional regulator [Gottschalkia purinilytica]|uniref:Putative transcriptional regulator n=1 Tax=Gottschalkia purinilytica TaxID=1503 RepID=A0A0L0WEK4_GOTPU|nr:helix-turn-helix transcriptional regulator [Gottschalkia purinilytica]KNF09855.1 putative transcriptional regulator [Gottschalkia purinilytica]
MFKKELVLSIMESKGWTKYRLAKEAGLAHSTLHDIISGKNVSPTARTLQKLADALNVSIDELMEDESGVRSYDEIEVSGDKKENKSSTVEEDLFNEYMNYSVDELEQKFEELYPKIRKLSKQDAEKLLKIIKTYLDE